MCFELSYTLPCQSMFYFFHDLVHNLLINSMLLFPHSGTINCTRYYIHPSQRYSCLPPTIPPLPSISPSLPTPPYPGSTYTIIRTRQPRILESRTLQAPAHLCQPPHPHLLPLFPIPRTKSTLTQYFHPTPHSAP
jgi:hypothetical protein